MLNDLHQKVQACHLRRNAYLYVRQSNARWPWVGPRNA